MTIQQLQRITLQHQGLRQTSPFGKGKKAVLKALEHLGYLQIDTLSVVERAHHHTLWTRIPDYQHRYLDELVKERKVFEYWFHAASYLPMKDFRYALPQMREVKQNDSHYYNADPKVMQYVVDAIKAEGPKQARDFQSARKKAGSWWNWKPTKLALERLFMQGDLMICERNGMQKTYDLSERVLPPEIDLTTPTALEFAEYLVDTYLRAYGFTTLKQITHLKTGQAIRKNVEQVLASKLEAGTIRKVTIDGLPPLFVQSDLPEKRFKKSPTGIRILSPFDNAVIHRDRLQQLFGFDFRLECYVPKAKRQYGYFCLPLLLGDTFIGRMDCKAHRKEKKLEIIHLHIENQHVPSEIWTTPLVESIKDFTAFNACDSLMLTKVSPSIFADPLRQILRKVL